MQLFEGKMHRKGKKKLDYSQHASRSSAPSSQSLVPSHNFDFSMHLGVASGPPLGQTNLFSGQVMAVQLFSSVPSVQSL